MNLKHCPKCNCEWEEKENIYDYFLNKYTNEFPELSDIEIKNKAKYAAMAYGCKKDNPKHFGKNVVGIVIPGGYDGVSLWKCQVCNSVFDRFTNEEVETFTTRS